MPTVKEFVTRAYRLVSAHQPTTPLRQSDLAIGLEALNSLLASYAATGLLLTIAKTESYNLPIGQQVVVTGPPTHVPVPDMPFGRLANLEEAWLVLEGVTYPLIDKSRAVFLEAWKFDPLLSLPRFIIVFPQTRTTELRLYPAASQPYELFVRGKYQFGPLASSDTMDLVPDYYERFLRYAVAKDIAMETGRADAWTEKLEGMLTAAQMNMEAASETNLSITSDLDSLLNGARRVQAGI